MAGARAGFPLFLLLIQRFSLLSTPGFWAWYAWPTSCTKEYVSNKQDLQIKLIKKKEATPMRTKTNVKAGTGVWGS